MDLQRFFQQHLWISAGAPAFLDQANDQKIWVCLKVGCPESREERNHPIALNQLPVQSTVNCMFIATAPNGIRLRIHNLVGGLNPSEKY